MIAFKPFQLCPNSERPLGIPLAYPWIMQECASENVQVMQRQGWTILTSEDYDAYVESMASEIEAWQTAKTQLGIEVVVSAAAQFGQSLMISYAAENVLLGITQEGMTGTILDRLSGVMSALQAGSLYEAIARIRAIPVLLYDTKYITAARLLVFINKIESYLGLPLSESV